MASSASSATSSSLTSITAVDPSVMVGVQSSNMHPSIARVEQVLLQNCIMDCTRLNQRLRQLKRLFQQGHLRSHPEEHSSLQSSIDKLMITGAETIDMLSQYMRMAAVSRPLFLHSNNASSISSSEATQALSSSSREQTHRQEGDKTPPRFDSPRSWRSSEDEDEETFDQQEDTEHFTPPQNFMVPQPGPESYALPKRRRTTTDDNKEH